MMGEITAKLLSKYQQAILLGDFNINLLKYGTHAKTTEFCDIMLSNGFIPYINRPTRITRNSATLIDHIYSNHQTNSSKSGIIITDVADHQATFHIAKNLKKTKTQSEENNPTLTRKLSPQNIETFKTLLDTTNFDNVNEHNDPNLAYNTFLSQYDELFNKAFPLTKVKSNKRYFHKEPWMTKGLLKSANTKNKLLMKKMKQPTDVNYNKYKIYLQTYNRIKKIIKRNYYSQLVENQKNNIKQTWKTVNKILQKKNDKSSYPDTLTINNKECSDSTKIVNEFNKFFSTIGKTVNSNVPHSTTDYHQYLGNKPNAAFFMIPNTPHEVEKITKIQTKTKLWQRQHTHENNQRNNKLHFIAN